jgi:hypothetical protein
VVQAEAGLESVAVVFDAPACPWSERPARPARCRGIGRTTSSRLVPWRRRALAQEPELRQHAPSPRMIVRPAGRTRTAKECPASSPTCLSGLIRSGSRGRQRARAKHAPLGSCQASLTIAGASWGVYGSGLVRRGAPCVDQLGGGDLQVAPWHGPVQRRAKDVANLVCRGEAQRRQSCALCGRRRSPGTAPVGQ